MEDYGKAVSGENYNKIYLAGLWAEVSLTVTLSSRGEGSMRPGVCWTGG